MANVRNTVAYFKKQVDAITAASPSSNTDGYLSIEKPDITTGQKEVLESELLSGNIGKKKPQLGFETASASVTWEMRSHGDSASPTEPDFGAILESALGDPVISTVEAVQAAPAPSTTEFGIATEGNLKKFDFMLIDNATDGIVGRFVKEFKIDIVAGINDKIDINEGSGELNATLTAGTYIHGGSAVVGSIGEEIKTQLEVVGSDSYTVAALENSDGSFTYTVSSDGTFSILNATGTNEADALLELNLGFGSADLVTAASHEAASTCWGNRIVCNTAMTTAPTAADEIKASVNYKPINEQHAHLTAGFYNGNSATDGYFEQVIGVLVSSLGINIETGAIAKFSAELAGLKGARTALTAAPHSPDYEDIQGLVGFCVEARLNDDLIDANAVTVSCENDVSEKKSFKECSGKIGSIVRTRTVTGTINPYADGSIDYYNALNNLTDYGFSLVIGVQDSSGWVPGRTIGIYLPQIMFSQDKTSDIDDNLIEDINFQAHTGEGGTETEMILSFA